MTQLKTRITGNKQQHASVMRTTCGVARPPTRQRCSNGCHVMKRGAVRTCMVQQSWGNWRGYILGGAGVVSQLARARAEGGDTNQGAGGAGGYMSDAVWSQPGGTTVVPPHERRVLLVLRRGGHHH